MQSASPHRIQPPPGGHHIILMLSPQVVLSLARRTAARACRSPLPSSAAAPALLRPRPCPLDARVTGFVLGGARGEPVVVRRGRARARSTVQDVLDNGALVHAAPQTRGGSR